MSYYTEGYVSKIELDCAEIKCARESCPFAHFWSPQVVAIGIEPTPAFKIEGRKDVGVLVDSSNRGANANEANANNSTSNDNVESKDNEERFSEKVADITNKESYIYGLNKGFFVNADARFLLLLKQNHTHVRIVFDDKRKQVLKIIVL